VLYNGERPLKRRLELADLLPKMPAFLRQYTLQMKYLLIDESCYSDEELASKKNLAAALFRKSGCKPLVRSKQTNSGRMWAAKVQSALVMVRR